LNGGASFLTDGIAMATAAQNKHTDLESVINAAWEDRASLGPASPREIRAAVEEVLSMLDAGAVRVAEKTASGWQVNQWLKKAVLLSFRIHPNKLIPGGPRGAFWYDKVESKFSGWGDQEFERAGFRAVPNCTVRQSAYIAKSVVLLPCFINVGAYVDEGTMIDTWSTVGSCAQIGKNCHISGGVGIGGVLEPLQADPVIIEDNVFIGARSEIAEGVRVEQGAVISMGVFIGASTKIIDRESGEVIMGRVPAYSVVIPGTLPSDKKMGNGQPSPSLACAVIVKRVDEKTRSKTGINELLRD
jgi:2,3,4,5-tetrahydropyridine-2,6-dicarboxylate N-succinyltransferase